MGTLAVDNIQHTDGSSAVTLNNATITAGTIAGTITGTLNSGASINWGGCRVWRSGTFTVASTTTTIVPYQTVAYDNLTEYNTSTFLYTPQYAGTYLITAMLQWIDMGDQKDMLLYIYKNSTNMGLVDHKSSSGNYESVFVSTIFKAVVGDTIHAKCRHSHGSNRDIGSGEDVSHMCIQRIA